MLGTWKAILCSAKRSADNARLHGRYQVGHRYRGIRGTGSASVFRSSFNIRSCSLPLHRALTVMSAWKGAARSALSMTQNRIRSEGRCPRTRAASKKTTPPNSRASGLRSFSRADASSRSRANLATYCPNSIKPAVARDCRLRCRESPFWQASRKLAASIVPSAFMCFGSMTTLASFSSFLLAQASAR